MQAKLISSFHKRMVANVPQYFHLSLGAETVRG
jgi:hypothetical protein